MKETIAQSPAAVDFISCEQRDDNEVSVLLSGNLSIAEASPLRAQLQEVLSQKKNVTLDGGSVERIDTAALQVLWAFGREVLDGHKSIKWTAASDSLLQAAALLGLADTMGLAARFD